ncbi:MAG: hypothetical protein ABSF71_02240 [Terriglobia bacterium]
MSIQKPYPRTKFDWQWESLTMHSRTPPPKEWVEFEAGQDEYGTSLITVEIILPADATEESLRKEMRGFVLPLLQQLVSWIRVLTRQFWLGYYGRSTRPQKYLLYIGPGEKDKPRHSGAVGWGLEYGRDLDATTWAQIGTKLALGERPRPSQLFFCDALLDISDGDLAQAIVALGVSCEIEIATLRQDILAGKDEEFGRLFEEYMRPRFEESFKLLNEFGCDPFSDFDKDACHLVRNLYRARGKAAHRGECYYVENGQKVLITLAGVFEYVNAVERLFAWSNAQRIRISERSAPVR